MPTTPSWKRVGALALALVVIAIVLLFHRRLAADFLPLDRSTIGPNLLASGIQWVVVFLVAVLLWPPTRRRIHRFVDRKADGIKDHLDVRHDELREWSEAEHARLHKKLDAIERHHMAHAQVVRQIQEQLQANSTSTEPDKPKS